MINGYSNNSVITTPPSSPIRRQFSEEELIDLSSQYVSSSSTCDCRHHPHPAYDLSMKSENSLKIHDNCDDEEHDSLEENSFEEWNDLYSERCCVIPNGATEEQILDELERAEEEHNKKRKHEELRRVIFNEISAKFH